MQLGTVARQSWLSTCCRRLLQVGLGVIRPGQLALLTGSSHLHLGVTDKV